MGPAFLFFLVFATAGPLLPAAQPFFLNYPSAKPSTKWINSNTSVFNSGFSIRPILVCPLQPQATNSISPAFAVGFLCASATDTTPCDMFLFVVATISVAGGTFLTGDNPHVVWSANRARPVRENASIKFTSDGNLVLQDADGSHVWSSSSSSQSVAGLMITEIGNLVMFDQRNETIWQSFDYPTDTLFLGQSLVQGMRLTANTSAPNMTKNQLYITFLRDGLYAFVEATPPQCYFKQLIGQNKTGNYPTNVAFMNGSLTTFGQTRWTDSGSILLPEATSTQFMRLESDGHLRLYEWRDDEWKAVYDVMGMDTCDYPTVCVEYGICTMGQCICPLENNSSSTYFKLVDEQLPNLGCIPITPISCQEIQRQQLLTLPNISYFEKNYMVVNATGIDECKQACLMNCSCKAVVCRHYPADSYYQIAYSRCHWVTEIFSLKTIQPESVGYNSTTYLKVQLIPYISASNSIKKKVMLGSMLGAITTLVLLAIVITLHLRMRRNSKDRDEIDFVQLPGMPTRFSFKKLTECTVGFSKKLGEGGFGSVFEGKLGAEKVAVKRLEGARQGKKEFLAEVETIGSIEHINLVSLIGFCAEKSERLLVYEYMSRGSLDRWIYHIHNNAPLDWCTRCRIILDVAKGLCYLHEECRRKIVHLDIKPQNILLDGKFNAKVADFGLCKLIERDQSKVMTMMRGTPGYLAPEWLTSRITEKVDVYSFGVVIMEIISGRKNIDNSQPEENVQLINVLREKAENNQLIDLIDKHSDDMILHQEEVIQMMKLAIWCLQHDSIQRPSMSIVIKVLEGVISIETFDTNSLMFVQDNPPTYSVIPQASILSGPR